MAIINNDVKFLFYCKSLGVDFDQILTLGRLKFYGSKEYIQQQIEQFGNNKRALDEVSFTDEYAEPVFQILGSNKIDSIDYSNYQQATILHDLNKPLPENLYDKYSVVMDSGTLEHVFNFPVAIESCMHALKVGGYYIAVTPVNNLMGHGFYQFSPELYYTIFSTSNGFEITKMIITASNSQGDFDHWYEVMNPALVKSRVELVNHLPTYLMIVAKKTGEKDVFTEFPQQSDYVSVWEKNEQSENSKRNVADHKKSIGRFLPVRFRNVLSLIYRELRSYNSETKDLGVIDSRFYKKMDI